MMLCRKNKTRLRMHPALGKEHPWRLLLSPSFLFVQHGMALLLLLLLLGWVRKECIIWIRTKGLSHNEWQSLGRLSAVIGLPDPYLRHVFGIDRWQGGVQGSFVQDAIGGGGKKHECHALFGLYRKVKDWKGCMTTLFYVVQIHQDRHRALTTV